MLGLKKSILRAGTLLFHGTRCAGDFAIPDGPAWFAYSTVTATKWIDWSERLPTDRQPGKRRVLHLAARTDLTLLDTSSAADWHRLCESLTGDPEANIYSVAQALVGKTDGWMGKAEVMLCDPASWLMPVVTPNAVRLRMDADKPNMVIELVSDPSVLTSMDDPDDFLYHVSPEPLAAHILTGGLRPGMRPTFSNWSSHSAGRIFLTERAGVTFWLQRVSEHLEHDFDDPPPTTVLRVQRSAVVESLQPDMEGSRDAREPSWFVTVAVPQALAQAVHEPPCGSSCR